MSTWQNRIVGTGEEAPDQLLANPRNWRIHPQHQQDALAGVLKEIGWVQDVIVNRRTGFVVDGRLRVALALRYQQSTVPVKYVDLSDAEEVLVLATLDPIGAMAGRDDEKLHELIADANPQDAELKKLLAAVEADTSGVPSDDAQPTLLTTCPQCGHEFDATKE